MSKPTAKQWAEELEAAVTKALDNGATAAELQPVVDVLDRMRPAKGGDHDDSGVE